MMWMTVAGILVAGAAPIPDASRQLVVVVTGNPDATSGTLQRFERSGSTSEWKRVGDEIPIVVGRTGLASGRGLHSDGIEGLPAKVEGDGKSPAGVFALTEAFGFAPSASGVRIPYVPVTRTLECVDDRKSSRYNQLVERESVEKPDWSSSEKMREIEGYEWGVVVAQNSDPVRAGEGSCVFLHAWSGPDGTTAGCTAMELERIRELVHWLRGKDSPILVQLTAASYKKLRLPWKLPPRSLEGSYQPLP